MGKLQATSVTTSHQGMKTVASFCIECTDFLVVGSLSKHLFETGTASELFSLLSHTTTFALPSIFSPLEMSGLKIWETIRS